MRESAGPPGLPVYQNERDVKGAGGPECEKARERRKPGARACTSQICDYGLALHRGIVLFTASYVLISHVS